MKTLSSEMSVGEIKEVKIFNDGLEGFRRIVGYEEMEVGKPINFENYVSDDLSEFKMMLIELDYSSLHRDVPTKLNKSALYGVISIEEIFENFESRFKATIKRIK